MEQEPARYICSNVCPFAVVMNALKRFATRHIPIFRKRAERAAVCALIDKLRLTTDSARDARTAASDPARRRAR